MDHFRLWTVLTTLAALIAVIMAVPILQIMVAIGLVCLVGILKSVRHLADVLDRAPR